MGNLGTKDTLKAETILRQLEGMSMVSALGLLDWCKEQLLLQPVEWWTVKNKVERYPDEDDCSRFPGNECCCDCPMPESR